MLHGLARALPRIVHGRRGLQLHRQQIYGTVIPTFEFITWRCGECGEAGGELGAKEAIVGRE